MSADVTIAEFAKSAGVSPDVLRRQMAATAGIPESSMALLTGESVAEFKAQVDALSALANPTAPAFGPIPGQAMNERVVDPLAGYAEFYDQHGRARR